MTPTMFGCAASSDCIFSLPSFWSQFATSEPTSFRSGYCEITEAKPFERVAALLSAGRPVSSTYSPAGPTASTQAAAPSAAPCALLATSCDCASPSSLISALTRNTGMSAATSFFTAPMEPLASAGSRMTATDLLVIAVSTRSLSFLESPLCEPIFDS